MLNSNELGVPIAFEKLTTSNRMITFKKLNPNEMSEILLPFSRNESHPIHRVNVTSIVSNNFLKVYSLVKKTKETKVEINKKLASFSIQNAIAL